MGDGLLCRARQFLSTPSARRATDAKIPKRMRVTISIHALREEGDCATSSPSWRMNHFYPRPPRGGRLYLRRDRPAIRHFYPRPPRGGRLQSCIAFWFSSEFLSTPSARRATLRFRCIPSLSYISIHALREEGDCPDRLPQSPFCEFLSTPSARRATPSSQPPSCADCYFYPRPPRGGRRKRTAVLLETTVFLSTPSARRATQRRADGHRLRDHFYPRPP